MDSYEGEQIEDRHVNHMYQWNTGGVAENAFGPIAAPLIENGVRRSSTPAVSIIDPGEDVQILTLTVPARWFDHAAERFCDLTHTNRVYLTRARNYTNTTSKKAPAASDSTTRVYIFQFFFQIISILWRWKDSNDNLPWATGIPATDPDAEDSEGDPSSDEDAEPSEGNKRKRKKTKSKRKRLKVRQNTSFGGAVRPECSLLIDWRWREFCEKCQAMRKENPWAIIFCDHVDDPRDMMPILDYTFWFLVRGWGKDVWTRRVGYAAIAAVKRLHVEKVDARNEWNEPGEDDVNSAQNAPSEECKWNSRQRDGSDMWKNIQCAEHFVKSARIYLQCMNMSRAQIDTLLTPPGQLHTHSSSIRNLVESWNPFKVFSVATTFNHLRKNDIGMLRNVLLEASTMEIKYSDISNWPQFWRRFLPHYDFMCIRGFEDAFPGIYYRNVEEFFHAQMAADASRSIKFVSAFQSDTRALPPIYSNSDRTKVWRIAEENNAAVHDGEEKLIYGFMQQHNNLFSEDEHAIVMNVWNYVRRRRAFIKYMLQCRSSESHLSHALVCLWDEYEASGGAVYQPSSIRPPHYGAGVTNPWDFYYHNLSPFGNFMVNRAYQLWKHFNVDPPHVKYANLMVDSANNATRGERHIVGLNPMVYSSEGGTGKSFIKDDVVAKTRACGTTTVVSHRSGAVQNIQRLGTHDDMVLLTDEIKQKTFANKDEGGMADPKVKELMSAGETQSQVMTSNPGGRGSNDRDIKTYLYRELCTIIATGNLNIMQIKDVAFLSRWLLLPLNVQHNVAIKRPREPPKPPVHVIAQMHQIQYAAAEIHKMVQVGAMDVEDTYVVTIILDALKGEFSKYGSNTQRKEMQIRGLARIHAITDLIVTHFWTPGGLFYNSAITPSHLVTLNDFLMVRMEHVIYALGQIDDLLTLTDEHLIKLAIVYMWRQPNSHFTVGWGGRDGEDERIDCHDIRDGRAGFISSLSKNTYDTIEFRGKSLSFMKQFSVCIHHVIRSEITKDPTVGSNIPTEEQIAAQLQQWCARMCNPKRATLKDQASPLMCFPDGLTFTAEVLPAEPMCRTSIRNGEISILFPVHMLLSSEPQPSLVESPQLKQLIAFSVEYTSMKVANMHGKSKARNDTTRTFVLGKEIPDRQEYLSVAQFPPEATKFSIDLNATTATPITDDRPTIPYRFYEDIMEPDEFTELSGLAPPAARDHPVPLLFSLDEFAVRSRVMKLGHNVGVVTNCEFGSIVSKFVLANFAQKSNAADFATSMRPTMMIWGNIYQKSSAEIYTTMQTPPANIGKKSMRNVLCDYQEHKFTQSMHDEESIREAFSHEHFIVRRTRAINRIEPANYTDDNIYGRRTRGLQNRANIYPESVPYIAVNNAAGSSGRQKRNRIPKKRSASSLADSAESSTARPPPLPHIANHITSMSSACSRASAT